MQYLTAERVEKAIELTTQALAQTAYRPGYRLPSNPTRALRAVSSDDYRV